MVCIPRTTHLAPGLRTAPLRMYYVVKGRKELGRVGRERFQAMGIAWVRGCDSESEKACVGGRLRSKAVRSIA